MYIENLTFFLLEEGTDFDVWPLKERSLNIFQQILFLFAQKKQYKIW